MAAAEFDSLRFRRSITALVVDFCIFVILTYAVLFVISSILAALSETLTPSSATFTLIYRIVCLLCFLELLRRYFDDLYIIAEEGVVHFEGRVSLSMRKKLIVYGDIRETAVEQGLLGRFFGYGTLKFATASMDKEEMYFNEIASPKQLELKVQRIIASARLQTKGSMDDADYVD